MTGSSTHSKTSTRQLIALRCWWRTGLSTTANASRVVSLTHENSKQAQILRPGTGESSLGLIHPASAGHGLNLQAGGHLLVWFSLTWSLELYQQTNARIYRQGQSEPVTITHLVAEGTLDEAVLKALETKDATQAALIDAVTHETHTTTTSSRKELSCM